MHFIKKQALQKKNKKVLCNAQYLFYLCRSMVKKIISYILASLFLTSSVLLPLGDFSLVRDLPGMYHNYTKITTDEELGIVDFIGDYLLHGKEIFGNNEHDKPQNSADSVQFQHQPNSLIIAFLHRPVILLFLQEPVSAYPIVKQIFSTSDYRDELFRPPLS